ncbi:MAG: hypothetical protein VSS75_007235 [Candidatus Parabeggiatoa sp.]|nr:hypothetical protein [Candidatus Parabeggiatoa sp.]
METIKEIFSDHYQWIFSGIGVAVLSLLVGILTYWFRSRKGYINISTKGDNSPGFVGGYFRVGKDD